MPVRKRESVYRPIPWVPVARAQSVIDQISAEPAVFLVYPNMLRCRRCGTYWVADKPLNTDIKDVTCSNCYSDQVFMSSVKIQLFEERP
jgi:Zn finger protein HypA/HybF involved in hydrogenase expression